jgi:hypothetical protein
MAQWLVEQVESSDVLYVNFQRMHIETVYTKTHIQLKIIIFDLDFSNLLISFSLPKVATEWITLLLRIQDIPGSSLSPET